MATSTNALFASSRSARSVGLVVVAGILFMATIGGSGVLYGAYTGAIAQSTAAAAHGAS